MESQGSKEADSSINGVLKSENFSIVSSGEEGKIEISQVVEKERKNEAGDALQSKSVEVGKEHLSPSPTDRSPEKNISVDQKFSTPKKSDREVVGRNGARLSDSSKSGYVSPSSSSSLSSESSSSNKPVKKKARKSDNVTAMEPLDAIQTATATNPIQTPSQENLVLKKVVSPNLTSLPIKQPQNQSPQVKIGRPRSNSVPHNYYSSSTTVPSLSLTRSDIAQSQPEPQKHAKKQNASTGKSSQLRRGKWTVEEEAYVARVIQDFNSGYLKASAGTTLRTYLSDKLNCDPMRITKKFTGDACIGKRVFHPAVRCSSNAALIDKAQSELDVLEQRWRRRLEVQQREAAKKQAASAAAATAAAMSGRIPLIAPTPTSNISTLPHAAFLSAVNPIGQTAVIAQTASWLDRANAILSSRQALPEEQKIQEKDGKIVQKEMEEVQRLIHEGPIIQKTSKGLTKLLEATPPNSSTEKKMIEAQSKRKVSEEPESKKSVEMSTIPEKSSMLNGFTPDSSKSMAIASNTNNSHQLQEKRMIRSYSANHISSLENVSAGAAEDAATLMSFLTSVREMAASKKTSNTTVATKKKEQC